MTLSDHVRILGRGPGRSRDLTQDEAEAAMQLMLSGDAAPEAIGALLMLLRMKGETPAEIAGFAQGATASVPALPPVDLDWPSYAAGRTRGAPWFLLAARLVARAGHRVLLHGWNGSDPTVRSGLAEAGIGMADTPDAAARLLDRDGIAYLPLENLAPALFALLRLREVLGLRSCVNTVCRMLNPARAEASVQGVFHPSYRALQADAAALLGWRALSVLKGAGGEFEVNPAKEIAVEGLRAKERWNGTCDATLDETRRMASPDAPALHDLWQARASADFETRLVIATAALALETLGEANAARQAETLWQDRGTRHAA